MSENRPQGRRKHVTGVGTGAEIHGEALNTGSVGQGGREENQAAPAQQRTGSQSAQQGGRPKTTIGQSYGSANIHGAGLNTGSTGQGARPGQNPQAGQRPAQNPRPAQQQAGQRPAQNPRPAQQAGQRPAQSARPAGQQSAQTGGTSRASGKGFNPLILIIIAAVVLLGGGGGLSGLFGGGGDGGSVSDLLGSGNSGVGNLPVVTSVPQTQTQTQTQDLFNQGGDVGSLLSSLFGSSNSWYSTLGGGAAATSSYGGVKTDSTALNTQVASGSRAKYTRLAGNGDDTVTLMVYMCGTDLESKYSMATADLREMASATYGDDVNIIVYTGGCAQWKTQGISTQYNQIYRVADGKLICLKQNDGTSAMTNPANLTRFIQFCAQNYPATRYELILWDHGGGSVSGYGYDEKYRTSGSMSLAGLNTALKDAGVKFDFIGFDACLMATVETALMASNYADYMIASEESEPGIGWYYTNWLSTLGRNTSTSTLEIGKQICDDFTAACNQQARGQQTTLSLVDLAELSNTVPAKLTAFSKSITGLIAKKDYNTVSNARNGSREFAQASRIDQVDLSDLATKMGTQEGTELVSTLRSAVKYNRVTGMTNAYGLSIYFPYQKATSVDKAVNTYRQIGMDDSYAECIRAFAATQVSGQAATGGTMSPISSLLGGASTSDSSSGDSADLISSLLSGFLGGGDSGISGLSSGGMDFLFGRNLSDEELISLVQENHLDNAALFFTQATDGSWVMKLTPAQWNLVHGVDRNIYIDNGSGYIDLGLDNTYSWTGDGALAADTERTWLALNGQIAPYYHLTDEADGDAWRTTGYIPALVDDEVIRLMVVFDSEHENGYIAGIQPAYDNGETDTVAKAAQALNAGASIQLVCDFYAYDGTYQNNYRFGNPISADGELVVTDVLLPDDLKIEITYRLTDVYNQQHWTNTIR